jgi:hypothetical protein
MREGKSHFAMERIQKYHIYWDIRESHTKRYSEFYFKNLAKLRNNS